MDDKRRSDGIHPRHAALNIQAAPATTTGFVTFFGAEIDGANGTLASVPGGSANDIDFIWFGWHTIALIKLGVSILPAPPKPFVTTPYTFSASITTGTPPSHITYQWDFGDGTAQVTKTDDSTAVHTYAAVGTYPVTVVLLNPTTKQPMVTATASAVVTDPDFAWQLTSVTLTSSSAATRRHRSAQERYRREEKPSSTAGFPPLQGSLHQLALLSRQRHPGQMPVALFRAVPSPGSSLRYSTAPAPTSARSSRRIATTRRSTPPR